MIYYWNDGCWCREDELQTMLRMKSDIFDCFDPEGMTDKEVEREVQRRVKE